MLCQISSTFQPFIFHSVLIGFKSANPSPSTNWAGPTLAHREHCWVSVYCVCTIFNPHKVLKKSSSRIWAGLIFPSKPRCALERGDLGGDCVGILGHCCSRCQPVVHVSEEYHLHFTIYLLGPRKHTQHTLLEKTSSIAITYNDIIIATSQPPFVPLRPINIWRPVRIHFLASFSAEIMTIYIQWWSVCISVSCDEKVT